MRRVGGTACRKTAGPCVLCQAVAELLIRSDNALRGRVTTPSR
jgi:hypothetical protein